MISYLHGHIIELDFNTITIMTSGGVWYQVWISERNYVGLSLEQTIEMPVYHHITEWNQSLFWFSDISEKSIFTELIKISWIGGKVAMQMLSLGASRLVWAVQSGDNKTIESIKGIWKKMAEKVILELKDKDFIISWVSETGSPVKVSSTHGDVVATLVNMWYESSDIERVLSQLPEEMKDLGEIIPYVIKNI